MSYDGLSHDALNAKGDYNDDQGDPCEDDNTLFSLSKVCYQYHGDRGGRGIVTVGSGAGREIAHLFLNRAL